MVHCHLGISRTPRVIIAYLMRELQIPLMEVLEFVQSEQTFPRVRPSKNLTRQLQGWENKDHTVPKSTYKRRPGCAAEREDFHDFLIPISQHILMIIT